MLNRVASPSFASYSKTNGSAGVSRPMLRGWNLTGQAVHMHAYGSISMRTRRMASHVVCAMRGGAGNTGQPRSSAGAAAEPQQSSTKGAKVVPLPKPSTVVYEEGEFVEVGRVSGAFGVRGEVRVEISTDNPRARFGMKGNRLFLRAPQPEGLLARMQAASEPPMIQVTTVSAKVQILKRGEEAWLVKVAELDDRSQAEQLLDYTIHIPLADRETLRDPDEFWVQDLVGCTVVLKASQKPVGRVLDLISGTGTHDTLLVELAMSRADILASQQRRCMVPFVKAFLPVVDKEQRVVVVDPPEGLLDISTPVPLRRKLTPDQQAKLLEQLKQGQPAVPLELVQEQSTQAGGRVGGAVPVKAKPGVRAAEGGGRGKGQAATAPKGVAPAAGKVGVGKVGGKQAVVRDEENEEEEEDNEMLDEDESASGQERSQHQASSARDKSTSSSAQQAGPQGGSQNWKLRRRLGVSLAAAQRKPGLRGARAARTVEPSEDEATAV